MFVYSSFSKYCNVILLDPVFYVRLLDIWEYVYSSKSWDMWLSDIETTQLLQVTLTVGYIEDHQVLKNESSGRLTCIFTKQLLKFIDFVSH